MAAKTDILAAIQAAVDASGNLPLRVSLGTPGFRINVDGETKTTGTAYHIPGFLDALLEGIGGVLDAGGGGAPVAAAWGDILTNALAVAPTLTNGGRVGVLSKTADTLTISFSPAFASAPAASARLVAHAQLHYLEIVTLTASALVVRFRDGLDVPLSIDSRRVVIWAVGTS